MSVQYYESCAFIPLGSSCMNSTKKEKNIVEHATLFNNYENKIYTKEKNSGGIRECIDQQNPGHVVTVVRCTEQKNKIFSLLFYTCIGTVVVVVQYVTLTSLEGSQPFLGQKILPRSYHLPPRPIHFFHLVVPVPLETPLSHNLPRFQYLALTFL